MFEWIEVIMLECYEMGVEISMAYMLEWYFNLELSNYSTLNSHQFGYKFCMFWIRYEFRKHI